MANNKVTLMSETTPHAVTGTLDVHAMTPMQQTVQHGRCHHLVAEHRTPLLEALVGGQDRGAPFMACTDQLEEQSSAVLRQRGR